MREVESFHSSAHHVELEDCFTLYTKDEKVGGCNECTLPSKLLIESLFSVLEKMAFVLMNHSMEVTQLTYSLHYN